MIVFWSEHVSLTYSSCWNKFNNS